MAGRSFACPHCGADVPAGSQFCRECGASDDAGWGEDAEGLGLSEPFGGYAEDDDFDYDAFVARELPDQAERSRWGRGRGRAWAWGWLWVVPVLLLVAALVLGHL